MKFEDIKDLTVEELRKRRKQLHEELFEMRMKHSLGQLGNALDIRHKRKSIARVQTALNQKLQH